jgi:tetratricopeptide (TPR) repeat protein
MRRDGPQKRGAPKRAGADRKRTSRSSDDRNPTHSSVDYPTPKFRRRNEEPVAAPPSTRSSLRKVRRPIADEPVRSSKRDRATKGRPGKGRPIKGRTVAPTRRRKLAKTEAGDELARIAGRGARHAQTELARAAEAFSAGRERDAARLLRPLRDAYPDASAVRELLGLCQYRLGQYAAATKELEAFVELSNSVEQHPVLMDCARALGKHRRVEELWEELAAASPAGALVAEGRIVRAGDLADQGSLTEAIATLDRRAVAPNRVQEHHVRVWYALADLYERAGDLPKARDLFLQIRRHDAGFADAAERLAALG